MLGERQDRAGRRPGAEAGGVATRPVSLYVNSKDKYMDRLTAQLEFYWSDANVKRDRFFADRLARDAECWVTVDELLSFPIVRALKASASDVLVAAKHSEFFLVRQEEEASRPPCIDRNWRKFPPRESIDLFANLQQDADRTVYVEPLPLRVKREELAPILESGVGPVAHISMPRHPVTGERLGHAFVEFFTAADAKLCVRRLHRTWPEIWSRRKDGRRLTVLSYRRWLALRDEVKTLSKQQPRLGYSQEVKTLIAARPQALVSGPDVSDEEEEEVGSSADCLDNEDELSAIRPNSVAKFSNLPPCTPLELKIWLAHFCAPVQHLDFRPETGEAFVRLAGKAERKLFLADVVNHKLPIKGVLPQARALTPAEFHEYFENFQRQRFKQLRILGPIAFAERKSPRRLPTGKQTLLAIKRGWTSRRHSDAVAWTDTVAGNERWSAPGTSSAFRKPFDRMNLNRRSATDAAQLMSPRKRRKITSDF